MSSLIRRGGDHQDKALLGGRELRNVVIRMRPTDVLLHGAITLLLNGSMLIRCEHQNNESDSEEKKQELLDHPSCSINRWNYRRLLQRKGQPCIKWGARRIVVEATRKRGQDTHTQASFPTIGPIIILQRTDDFIVGVGDRERAGQRCPGRHGLHESVLAAGLIRRGQVS